jgi:O-antigen ligase
MGCLLFYIINWESALTRWEATIYDQNTAGRDIIMVETVKLIQERPIIGYGPVTAEYALGASLGLPFRGTHNLWLNVLLQDGVIGAIPYVIGVLLCLGSAWRSRRGEAGVLPLSLIAVVMVANLSVVWDNQKVHWLVLALALASGTRIISWAGKQPRQSDHNPAEHPCSL